MSHLRLEQPWLDPDNPRPRQPKSDHIVSGIHQQNPRSSQGQWCQDSGVRTALFQLRNSTPRQYFWHFPEDRGSAQQESRSTFQVYGWYLFDYCRSWNPAARHAGCPENRSNGSCRIHEWLSQSSLREEADLAFPTTDCLCSYRCIFCDVQSLQGAPVQNRWCGWNGRCAKMNCIHLKISRYYNVLEMCEWTSIQLSSPSMKSSLERSFGRGSADWHDSRFKLSSQRRRCWSIHIFVSQLNDWACWMSCADRNGCHGFHCSEYLRCLLYNPVALPYSFPPVFSTPTTCMWALVFVGSEVQVRSGFWGSIVSLSGVSSGAWAPVKLSMRRWISWLSSSMAIQVHRLKSNHDGSGRSQPPGG